MKNRFVVTLSAFALSTGILIHTASAETAGEIVTSLHQQMVEKLTAYLEANPEAPDRGEAVGYLVQAHLAMEQPEKAVPLLEEKWKTLDKGAGGDPDEIFQGTFVPLFQAYQATGQTEKALEFLAQADKDLAQHPAAGQFSQVIAQISQGLQGMMKQPKIGETLEISFTSLEGKEVDLSKMTESGKVVLVDFWATWCGPCIEEIPNVKAAYDKYHDKGFEVIGISLDQDKAALEAYVKENNLEWPQGFDGKSFETPLAQKYSIEGIPATFLVGKDGKIVARDLRGNQLEKQLEKLLGEE